MAIKMDLSQFKHIKSDKHSTTLQHKDGHMLTLSHSALSPESQVQLKALSSIAKNDQTPGQAQESQGQTKMADGGKVEYDEYGYPKKPKPSPTPAPTPRPTPNEFHQTGSGIEDVSGYADGGDVQADPTQPAQTDTQAPQQIDPAIAAKRELYNKIAGKPDADGFLMHPEKTFGPQGEAPQAFDPDAWQATESQMKEKQALEQSDARDKQAEEAKVSTAKAAASIQPPDSSVVQASPMPADPNQAPAAPVAPQAASQELQSQVPASGGGMSTDPAGLLQQGLQQGAQGVDLAAKAEGALGTEQGKIQQQQGIEASQRAQQVYQANLGTLQGELNAHMADVKNGLINPDKYWTGDPSSGMGSHSKIATGIGMILAGFNPAGTPNAAIEFLKHNMDKNIEAQSKNLDMRNNLVRANLEQFHNLRDAADMSRLQQADVVGHYLDQAAANAKGPLAKAAAMQAKSQLAQTYSPLLMNMNIRQTLMNLGSSGQPQDEAAWQHLHNMLMIANPEMAKDMEQKHVPGLGNAAIPVPPEARQQLIQGKQLDTMVRDLHNFASTHSTMVPGTAEYNTGKQKALALQSAVREGQLGTVYKAGEQPLLDTFVNSNPAGLTKAFSTLPKLDELLAGNTRRMNDLKTSYGLPVQQQKSMQPQAQAPNHNQAIAWAKANPNDPRAAKILQLQGK